MVRLLSCKRMEEPLLKEVEMMLELRVIEPSQSEWRSNPMMVPKPDGFLRVCLDFTWLNEVSKFDAYPMPQIQELLERLGGAVSFDLGYDKRILTNSIGGEIQSLHGF